MDNIQLSSAIRNNLPTRCANRFLGCLTVDELTNVNIPLKHDPVFIIINILPSSKIKRMGHWVLLYVEKKLYIFLIRLRFILIIIPRISQDSCVIIKVSNYG